MPKTDISATDVARILGMPYKTLDAWLATGIITCDVPAAGTGNRRRFTAKDLALAALACGLIRGCSATPTARAAQIIALFRRNGMDDDPDKAGIVIVDLFDGHEQYHWLPAADITPVLDAYLAGQPLPAPLFLLVDARLIARRAYADFWALLGQPAKPRLARPEYGSPRPRRLLPRSRPPRV